MRFYIYDIALTLHTWSHTQWLPCQKSTLFYQTRWTPALRISHLRSLSQAAGPVRLVWRLWCRWRFCLRPPQTSARGPRGHGCWERTWRLRSRGWGAAARPGSLRRGWNRPCRSGADWWHGARQLFPRSVQSWRGVGGRTSAVDAHSTPLTRVSNNLRCTRRTGVGFSYAGFSLP